MITKKFHWVQPYLVSTLTFHGQSVKKHRISGCLRPLTKLSGGSWLYPFLLFSSISLAHLVNLVIPMLWWWWWWFQDNDTCHGCSCSSQPVCSDTPRIRSGVDRTGCTAIHVRSTLARHVLTLTLDTVLHCNALCYYSSNQGVTPMHTWVFRDRTATHNTIPRAVQCSLNFEQFLQS